VRRGDKVRKAKRLYTKKAWMIEQGEKGKRSEGVGWQGEDR